MPVTLLKRDSNSSVFFFFVKFAKFLKAPFFTGHFRWLLKRKSKDTKTLTDMFKLKSFPHGKFKNTKRVKRIRKFRNYLPPVHSSLKW